MKQIKIFDTDKETSITKATVVSLYAKLIFFFSGFKTGHKVFAIGPNKTGTSTLTKLFESYRLKTVHYLCKDHKEPRQSWALKSKLNMYVLYIYIYIYDY